jgi:hypothetical protein
MRRPAGIFTAGFNRTAPQSVQYFKAKLS